MYIRSLFFMALTSALPFASHAQLLIPGNVRLPKDTLIEKRLLASLNRFFSEVSGSDTAISLVMPTDMLGVSALRDEMKGLGRSVTYKDDHFYKAYLTNATQTDDTTFLVQLSYMGVNEGVPMCRASFSVLAKKEGAGFYFSSPLELHTTTWKSKRIGNVTVHYKQHLNTSKARAYFGLVDKFDRKLGAPEQVAAHYCADNFPEAQHLLGVDYKADYNGYAHNSLSARSGNRYLSVNGTLTSEFAGFDPHDLWHERLHNVLSTSIINRPVDEGTAYLYGGSWGFTWKEILEKFRAYAAANRDADWLVLYNESKNFDDKAKFPLNVDFAINALIVEKIEQEKGFASVFELLSCGKKEEGNANYFSALMKVAGISKERFNESVWALIDLR